MNCPATLLCKNPSEDENKRIEQNLICAFIEGYTDATAELSKFITKLYKEKNPNASIVYNTLQSLIKQQDENYDKLCEELNEI